MNRRKKILYSANLSNIIVCFISFIITLVIMVCMLFGVRFLVHYKDPLRFIFNLSLTTQKDILIFVSSGAVIFLSLLTSILLSAYAIKFFNTRNKKFNVINIINFIVSCFFVVAFFIVHYYNVNTLFLQITSYIGMSIFGLISLMEFISICWKETNFATPRNSNIPVKEIKQDNNTDNVSNDNIKQVDKSTNDKIKKVDTVSDNKTK